MNQPTTAPTAKMTAVGASGAVVTVLVAILAMFGVSVPSDVSGAVLALVAALTTIINFVAGYMKRERAVRIAPTVTR